jgi:hypothetical protein
MCRVFGQGLAKFAHLRTGCPPAASASEENRHRAKAEPETPEPVRACAPTSQGPRTDTLRVCIRPKAGSKVSGRVGVPPGRSITERAFRDSTSVVPSVTPAGRRGRPAPQVLTSSKEPTALSWSKGNHPKIESPILTTPIGKVFHFYSGVSRSRGGTSTPPGVETMAIGRKRSLPR